MAIAVAGGGLLATAAGAVPAHAATAPASASHTYSFSVVPAAQAAGGITPKFQCGDSCDPTGGGGNPLPPPVTITCTITANTPTYTASLQTIFFTAITNCTSNLPQITMSMNVIHPGVNLFDNNIVVNDKVARTAQATSCSTGQWAVNASALITLPTGWVILAGSNPIVQTSPTLTVASCSGVSSGGGCATAAPSVPAQPAARHPDVISCP
jgi:hypothetical protein